MKTFADVKRALAPGLRLHAQNYLRPEATGMRTVDRVQTNGFWFRIDGDERRGWFAFPSAKFVRVDGNRVTFLCEDRPVVTFTFPTED